MSMRAYVLLLSIMVLGCGCTITLGPLDESDENEPRKTPVLPAPEQSSGEEPALDDAQQERKDEAERYVAQVIYQGAPITRTIALPSGDIIDGIDRASLPAIPYELPPLPWTPEELVLPEGVELGLMDVDEFPELLDLVATAAPFHRPTFWPYILGETDATSIEDYLDRYQVGGDPARYDRLYAGFQSPEPNRGVSGLMNQFRPEVAPDSFSLFEFAVGCPANGPSEEMIGVVISVDKTNPFGKSRQPLSDGEPRLHIEYKSAKVGKPRFAWDGDTGQFVVNPFRRARPGQIVPVSALSGTQVEHMIAIFQVPTGDWWIAYQHDLLGYYPASLFSTLNGGACRTAWYGEVYRPARSPGFENAKGAIKTEMGSGQFAEAKFLNAAYVRNPVYYDLLWFGVKPNGSYRSVPEKPSCYSRFDLGEDAAGDSFVFLGGPGGKSSDCQWPSP
jgi:hypothetical protein